MADTAPLLRILSLGAGVQSTTMALMAAHGEIGPMPDAAIFADTGWEPAKVYRHLEWLASGNMLPFPVHIVSAGNIREDILRRRNTTGGRFASVPWFTVNPDGSKGMGRRQCTSEYKLKPLMHKMRDLLGVTRRGYIAKGAVEVWVGISTDEASRMKPARQQWQATRWPLIELGMSRRDCERWLVRNEYPIPPKSACIGCPFMNNARRRQQREEEPDEFLDAVLIDRALRQGDARGMRATEYMHADRMPLDQVDLDRDLRSDQIDLFQNECEGMCGV